MPRKIAWPELEPTYEDFQEASRSQRAQTPESTAGKIFLVSKGFQMPRELDFTVSNLTVVGRKAGALSNYESAAATAWLQHNASSQFEGAPLAWTRDLVYKN